MSLRTNLVSHDEEEVLRYSRAQVLRDNPGRELLDNGPQEVEVPESIWRQVQADLPNRPRLLDQAVEVMDEAKEGEQGENEVEPIQVEIVEEKRLKYDEFVDLNAKKLSRGFVHAVLENIAEYFPEVPDGDNYLAKRQTIMSKIKTKFLQYYPKRHADYLGDCVRLKIGSTAEGRSFMQETLFNQNRIQTGIRKKIDKHLDNIPYPYQSRALNEGIYRLKLLPDWYFNFRMDERWINAVNEYRQKKLEEKLEKKVEIPELKLKSIMVEWINSPNHSKRILALLLATGRRMVEIIKLCMIEHAGTEIYKIRVSNLAKQSYQEYFNEEKHTVGCLLPADTIIQSFRELRDELKEDQALTNEQINKKWSSRLGRMCKKHLIDQPVHYLRTIYVSLLHQQEHSHVPVFLFAKQNLVHSSISTSLHYSQSIELTQE